MGTTDVRYTTRFIQSLSLLLVMLILSACIRKDVSKYTTPLHHETIQDICAKFELDNDKSCQPDQIVYAPDFFPAILNYFREGEFTHKDVVSKLGRYEYDCEQPIYVPSLDETYYSCAYDLNGDRVFPIGVFYDVEKDRHLVTRVIATIGDN